jgi:hypothetical protein
MLGSSIFLDSTLDFFPFPQSLELDSILFDDCQNIQFANSALTDIELVIPAVNNNINLKKNNESSSSSILNRKQVFFTKYILDNKRSKKHTKYDEDNICKKFKILIKDKLLAHINSKIKEDINLSVFEGQNILNINPTELNKSSIEDNKNLLKKEVKDIFSYKISGHYKNYPENYNKILIEQLCTNENGKNMKSIFGTKFGDCIKYFRKDKNYINNNKYTCLRGLEKGFENLREELSEDYDDEYIEEFINVINNFEKIYDNKKPRRRIII